MLEYFYNAFAKRETHLFNQHYAIIGSFILISIQIQFVGESELKNCSIDVVIHRFAKECAANDREMQHQTDQANEKNDFLMLLIDSVVLMSLPFDYFFSFLLKILLKAAVTCCDFTSQIARAHKGQLCRLYLSQIISNFNLLSTLYSQNEFFFSVYIDHSQEVHSARRRDKIRISRNLCFVNE